MTHKFRWWMGLLLLVAACGRLDVDVVTPTVPVATAGGTASQAPATTTAPTPAATAEPIATPSVSPSADTPPVEGLVYSAPDGIYWVDMTGQAHQIFDRPDAAISPDARQALYAEGDDIWLVTLGTGTPVNLTNTPDRIEHSPRWWPARPDLAVFGSFPIDQPPTLNPTFYPTIVSTDGSGYRVLDAEIDGYNVGLSPDGHTLAYGLGPVGYLYDLYTGQRTVFDPQDYDVIVLDALPAPTGWSIAGPAFSSDGVHMSWTLGQYYQEGNNNYALMIADLPAHTATLMHVYHLPPSDFVPGPGAWSPDGQWVAYYALADTPTDLGMWVARVNGSEERYLGVGNGPHWRPDGGWLAYNGDGGTTILCMAADWSATSISAPVNGNLIGW